jgi:hypothetical protein
VVCYYKRFDGMIFRAFGYTVSVFRTKPGRKLSSYESLCRVVSDGRYLRIETPDGNLLKAETTCIISPTNDPPTATVELFVNLDELHNRAPVL